MSISLVFIIIFFIIIAMLIVIAVYGSKKEKIRHQRDLIKKRKDDGLSKEKHKEIYIKLYFLLNDLEAEIQHFNHNSEIISLGEINKNVLRKFQEIRDSQDLKDVYVFAERKDEFKPVIEELAAIKPVKWLAESTYACNLINAKGKFLVEDQENQSLVEEAKNWLKK